jgi:hypothetical protein
MLDSSNSIHQIIEDLNSIQTRDIAGRILKYNYQDHIEEYDPNYRLISYHSVTVDKDYSYAKSISLYALTDDGIHKIPYKDMSIANNVLCTDDGITNKEQFEAALKKYEDCDILEVFEEVEIQDGEVKVVNAELTILTK